MKQSKILVSLIAVLIILVSVFLLVNYRKNILNSYHSLKYSQPADLEFSVKDCDKSISGFDSNQMGIKEVVWEDEKTLVVRVYVSVYCGGEDLKYPNYKVNGSNLVLQYKSIVGNKITKCVCAREMVYKIKNLVKKDYSVSIEEVK